jgi:hypothetical protein
MSFGKWFGIAKRAIGGMEEFSMFERADIDFACSMKGI